MVFVLPIAAILLVGAWIYLVWMVRKKKTNIFHDQMEPKLAERRLKRLKTFLLVAGIGFAVVIGDILHIAIFRPPDYEGPVSIVIAWVGFMAFIIATIGGLVIFLKGRRKLA